MDGDVCVCVCVGVLMSGCLWVCGCEHLWRWCVGVGALVCVSVSMCVHGFVEGRCVWVWVFEFV